MFHIIDDIEPIRTLLVEVIQGVGRQAKPFSSPDEYLEYVNSNSFIKPTAVITDVHMPVMTGYQMIEKILELFPDINFAVISGEPNIDSDYKDKVCMYLKKPFHPEAIEVIVNKFTCCQTEGASPAIGCSEFGDKAQFDINASACPKLP